MGAQQAREHHDVPRQAAQVPHDRDDGPRSPHALAYSIRRQHRELR